MAVIRPVGVTIVAALTLLSSFALAFLFLVFWAVSVVGMGSGLPLVFSNLPFYLPLLFAFFSFPSQLPSSEEQPLNIYGMVCLRIGLRLFRILFGLTPTWEYGITCSILREVRLGFLGITF
jgi:hypothetical protein